MNHTLFSAITGSVDAQSGIITNVSVATVGEAKGHGVRIDGTTLQQIKAAAAKSDSVQVKVDHWSGFDGIVGNLRQFRIDGNHLRADLHLLENHPARDRILEMAEKMPGNFGLSIAYLGDSEERDGFAFARVTELLAVDLVDAPAANPDGLFASVSPELVEMRRRHLAELEPLRASLHRMEMQVLEQQAEITELRRKKDYFERRNKMLIDNVEEIASRRAADIAASCGVSAPVKISPGRFEEELARMKGIDLAKAANKNRQP